jgi:BCCT family betaine/carnitine transporter
VLFILLPIALLFAQNSMNNLQSVSIIAAFPISIIIVIVFVSFVKDARLFLEESRASELPAVPATGTAGAPAAVPQKE